MVASPAPPGATPYIVDTHRLDKHEWDALVSDDDFFHSHGWLNALDNALGTGEILALESSRGLLGGCALWPGEKAPGLFSASDYFPGLPGPWHEEFLWGGARRSTHNEIPCIRGPRRGESLGAIAAALADLANQRRKTAAIVPYMPLRRAREVAAYYPHARVLMHSAEAAIMVPSGGLTSVLSRIGRHRRAHIKSELTAFSRKGIRLEWQPLGESLFDTAARLIANNREKHGSQQGPEWILRLLKGQKGSSVIDSAIAVLAKKENAIIGMSILYRFGQKLHARYYGSDYRFQENDFRYFALIYYYPLDYSAEHGISQYRLSISALHAKTLRGAEIEPLAALLLFNRQPEISINDCERYNHDFLRTYQQQYLKYLNPDWELLN